MICSGYSEATSRSGMTVRKEEHRYKKSGRSFCAETAFVEIPRFELGQTEPKSVVLPLHHISVLTPVTS